MAIGNISNAPSRLSIVTLPDTSVRATAAQWKLGRILTASLVEQLNSGNAILRIGDQLVRAQTQGTLKTGVPLRLEVIKPGQNPVLRLLDTLPSSTEIKSHALRWVVPRQMPVTAFVNTLIQAATGFDGSQPTTLRNILSTFPDLVTLAQPDGLKSALEKSGLFFEAHLATQLLFKQPTVPTSDFKGNLLRLYQSLAKKSAARGKTSTATKSRPYQSTTTGISLDKLAKHVESSLARIQFNQLHSLPRIETPHVSSWFFEIPYNDDTRTEVFQMEIQREAHGQGAQSSLPTWQIFFSITLARLGPLHARLRLSGQRLLTYLWLEKSSAYRLVDKNLGALQHRLTGVHFTDLELHCLHGKPDHECAPPIESGLINLTT